MINDNRLINCQIRTLYLYFNIQCTSLFVRIGKLQIVITVYLSSCLGQEIAKRLWSPRVKLPPAHLSTTNGGRFTLSLFNAEREAE